jgi:hypothetical protein
LYSKLFSFFSAPAPALVAAGRAYFSAQYEQLVKRGTGKKVTIAACKRRMLVIINALMTDRQPFRTLSPA